MRKLLERLSFKKKKKRTLLGSRGAVTIFLILVLVPTIVFAAIFTDVSRVQFSKSMADSAGDLALDALLAKYDEDLEQYYGMVASCQNIDEFYSKTTDYFAGMMRAEGISNANVEQFVDFMYRFSESSNVSDFLRTELETAGINVNDMDSQLDGNAALIEDEIVEFMKYRGPIEISEKLIDRFLEKGDGNVMGSLDEASRDEPIVEAKQAYAEAEAEFLEKAFYTYLAIRVYEKAYEGKNNSSEAYIPNQESYNSLENNTRKIWNDYKELTKLLTNYYICSGGVRDAKSIANKVPHYPIDWKEDEYSKEDIGTKVTVEGVDHFYLYSGTYENLYYDSNYQEDIDEITSAAREIYRALEAVQRPSDESDLDEVVYLIRLKEALEGQDGNFNTIKRCGQRLLILYAKIEAALECEQDPEAEGNALPDGWDSDLSNEQGKIYDCWESFLHPRSGYTQHDSNYKEWIKKYISLSDRVKGNIDNERYTFDSEYLGESNVSPSRFLGQTSSELSRLRSILQKRYDEIVNALGKGEVTVAGKKKEVVKIQDLLKLYNNYLKKRDNWGATANRESTNYAKDEQRRYNNVKSGKPEDEETNSDAIASEISKEGVLNEKSVTELESRLVAIKDDMKKAIDAIDAFQYGRASISDISSLSQLISAASSVIPTDSDISISVNNQASEGYFKSLIKPDENKLFKAPDITDKNNPDLSVATPSLYKFFKEKFQDKEEEIEQEISDNDKRKDNWKKQKDETEKKAKEADLGDATLNGHGTSPLNASGTHGGGSLGLVSALRSILSTINDFSNGGKQIRDKIYVIEYVMDMFSYSSYNTEGKYKLAKAGDSGTTYKDFDSYNGNSQWENEELTFTLNKSLTNRMINNTNNQFNLAEAEYVIFGNTDMQSCLRQSYTGIYTIRFTLNLISGFQNYYSSTDNSTGFAISSIANAIAAASQGIIPVCATKSLLITVLSAFEAAKDLDVLKKGANVPLYKSEAEQWYCGLNSEGTKDGSFGEGDNTPNAEGLYYSDYMYLFLMLNTSNYETMLRRIGDLVEANMRQSKDAFDLNKSKCFFKLTAHGKVKPLMLTLPLVQSYGTGNLLNSDGWCSYDIRVIRGY